MAKLFTATANLALLPLSFLAPRSPKQWVFGHQGGVFAGNPKYLFLWMRLHRPDIQVSWIGTDRQTRQTLLANGFPAYTRWSWAGIRAALRARVFIFAHDVSDVNAPLSRGAMRLNLWHGVGLKALQVGGAEGPAGWLRRLLVVPHDWVVTTSKMMQDHFSAQFRLPPERCPQLGYPRLDGVLEEEVNAAAVATDRGEGFVINPDGFAELYIYMPTYRDTERPFLGQALPDLNRLSTILARRNALLYLKPHPRTAANIPAVYTNIRIWPKTIDVHAYLGHFNGLITDYSSILYDYLFVKGKGAVLYTFDLAQYVSQDRTLLYSFEENVAGLTVSNFDALCEALADGSALRPIDSSKLETIRQRFWGGSSVPASKAIVAYVESELGSTVTVGTSCSGSSSRG